MFSVFEGCQTGTDTTPSVQWVLAVDHEQREVYYSPPHTADMKNPWSPKFDIPYFFGAWCLRKHI